MVTCFDLVVDAWCARFAGQEFPVALGRGGIGQKRGEGDGITPIGSYQITEVFWRNDRVMPLGNPAFSATPINRAFGWSDAPEDPAYNTKIDRHRSTFGHEQLYRADHLYDLIAVLDFNMPAKPAAGSAIFLHCWRGPRRPTEGCIAFAPPVLGFILENWTPRSRVIVR